jgi:hypothetical protein
VRNELYATLISQLYPGDILIYSVRRGGLNDAINVANTLDSWTFVAIDDDLGDPE